MIKALSPLLAIALFCALLLGLTHEVTTERIEHNESAHFWQQVQALTGINVATDSIEWHENVWHLCNGLALIRSETRGYAGPIHLLAAVRLNNAGDDSGPIVVRGVSVTRHQETPGIADFINWPEHPWMHHFVELDADRIGLVEGVTGATITSRAIARGLQAMTTHPALASSGCLP